MRISDLDFIRLLPAFMRDDEAAIALSKAVSELMGLQRIPTIRTWDEIDHLNEAECDELAWELDVDWYDSTYSLDIKRNLIKNAINVKRVAGTKASVLTVLRGIFGDAELAEWFQYGGEPYRFKVRTSAILTEDMASYFWELIKKIKNVRSHIEALEIIRETGNIIYAGCGQSAVYRPAAIIDGYTVSKDTNVRIYAGAAGTATIRPEAVMDGYQTRKSAVQMIHTGTAGAVQYRPAAIT